MVCAQVAVNCGLCLEDLPAVGASEEGKRATTPVHPGTVMGTQMAVEPSLGPEQ